MKRKMVDQGASLFDWAASQPVAVEPAAAPVAVKARKLKRQRIAAPAVEPVSSETAPVVDFLAKRPTMARWILGGRRDLQAFDLWFARKEGEIPPAPIIAFPKPHPASPGAYRPDPTARTG